MFSASETSELQKIKLVVEKNPDDKACLKELNQLRPTLYTPRALFALAKEYKKRSEVDTAIELLEKVAAGGCSAAKADLNLLKRKRDGKPVEYEPPEEKTSGYFLGSSIYRI